MITRCVDKVKVKEYIRENGLSDIIVLTLGVYNNANEINWDELPNKFVLKCNLGCGYNM